MLLTNILENSAQKFARRPALIMRLGWRTISLTYHEVYQLSQKTALFLEQQGLRKDDKVLLLAPNSPYWIILFWGCLLRGIIPVPLNIQSTSEMVKKIAEQTKAKFIFKYLHYAQKLPPHLTAFPIELICDLVVPINLEASHSVALSEDDIAEIMYTSGTTGDPKGVCLSHNNLANNVQALTAVIPLRPADRFLSILPLSHIFEQTAGFLAPFSSGATIIFAHSPAMISDLLKKYRVTKMAAVPEFLRIVMTRIEAAAEARGKKKIFEKLLNLSQRIHIKPIQRLLFRRIHKTFGGKLDTLASGGAPLDLELEKKWSALGIDLLQGYGLTETAPVLTCNTYCEQRPGSVGKALPGIKIKIGEGDEILAKGPNIFAGYFKNEEKTKATFTPDGWFKTGDIGELDRDGFLFIKGRKKYMIKGPGAQNVYPEDIEFELNKIPGVKDSAVIGLEKPNGQVEIHAVILLEVQPSPTMLKNSAAIVAAANQKLASYQQITSWSVWPEEDFPRSATRKVKKEEVMHWLKTAKPSAPAPKVVVAASSPLFKLLAEVTNTPAERIRSTTNIVSELGLDSTLRIELVARIEENFNVEIPETAIRPATTAGELERLVQKVMTEQKAPEKKMVFKRWPLTAIVRFLRMLLFYLLLLPCFKIFIKLKIQGKEHLQTAKLPVIFMPNHISYLDSAVVFMALPLRIRKRLAFAAAKDVVYGTYRKVALLLELFFNSFPFPRRPEENIKFGLEYLGQLLDQDWSVVIYPEGQVSQNGKLQPLKRGAGLIATEMNAQIIPVKISSTAEVLPYEKIFPRKRGLVTITFGKPQKFTLTDSYIETTEKIHGLLQDLQSIKFRHS